MLQDLENLVLQKKYIMVVDRRVWTRQINWLRIKDPKFIGYEKHKTEGSPYIIE